MKPCFGDTFFFLALLIERDEAHERAVETLTTLQRELYTTTWVLTELGDAMSSTPGARSAFASFLQFLRCHPKITIVPTTDELFDRGVDLYRNRPDKSWSLTDCISFRVMEENQIADALTGDHHFEQAGFVAMLK